MVIPLNDVEQLWREYDQFENKINKMTVRFISPTPLLLTKCDSHPCHPPSFPFYVGSVDSVSLAEQTSVCLYAEIHDLDFMLALSTRTRLLYLSTERHVTLDCAGIPLAAQSLYTSTSTPTPAFACSHMTYLF